MTPGAHTCAVTASGEIRCWGSNDFGQLGRGTISEPSPVAPITIGASGDGMIEVDLGGYHTCARQRIGRLWCWGGNHDWQIGFEDQIDRALPEQLTSGSPFQGVVDGAAGTWHSCGVTGTGELWCWGEGGEFRAGLPLNPDGTSDIHVPTRILEGRMWSLVETGHRHTCAIDTSGSLWCFGTSADGELGVRALEGEPASLPVQVADEPWTNVALGTSFTCGVRAGGALYCWGRNAEGQLGIGSRASASVPVRVCLP